MTDIENYNAWLHLDGNVLAAIDIETTGRRPGWHEIIQIGVQVLNKDLEPHTSLREHYFYKTIRPEHWDRRSSDASRIHNLTLEDLKDAPTKQEVADQFDEWFKRLPLPFKKRIIPLAHNWGFEKGFLENWLGPDACSVYFHPVARDSMQYAAGQNDRAHFHGWDVPYRFVNMQYLCKALRVENRNPHDALADARATAEVYKRMLMLDYGEF